MKRINKKGGTIGLITSLIMVVLFTIAIVTFSIKFGGDNNSKVNIANDSDFVVLKNDLSENVTTFYSDVGTVSNATQQSTLNTQIDSTEGGTSFKVGPGTALLMATSTITIAFKKIFGSGGGFGILITAFLSLLAFIFSMYIWKTWKGGSPD